MKRVLWLLSFVIVGLVLIALGLTIPANFRGLDARVVLNEKGTSPSVVDEGLALVSQGKIGPAVMLLEAARREKLPEAAKLQTEVEKYAKAHPEDIFLGGTDPYLASLVKPRKPKSMRQPVVDLLIPGEVRQGLVQILSTSRNQNMAKLLATRSMTNTVHFPPVTSASGQPLDAAILLTGLLLHENQLATPLRDRIEYLASRARWDNNLELLELIFLDLLSLGRHLTWGELTDFVSRINDPLTLQRLANRVALSSEQELPPLFTLVHLSSAPASVASYLNVYEKSGPADLSYSLRGGKQGLRLVLERQQPIYRPSATMESFTANNPLFPQLASLVATTPTPALVAKTCCLALGAMLIALSMARILPMGQSGIKTFWMPEIAFSILFLAITVLLTEPFLLQQSQSSDSPAPFSWKFPMMGGPLAASIQKKVNPMVDTLSIITLLLFLIIQITIYIFCRRKLAEIQREELPSKLKLRLLENEEHLFDAGLYVGFVGTVMSLVCVSIGIIKPSLMAAYSSTSFGIIFVTVLKIFHLRPYRKKLIMDTESPA